MKQPISLTSPTGRLPHLEEAAREFLQSGGLDPDGWAQFVGDLAPFLDVLLPAVERHGWDMAQSAAIRAMVKECNRHLGGNAFAVKAEVAVRRVTYPMARNDADLYRTARADV